MGRVVSLEEVDDDCASLGQDLTVGEEELRGFSLRVGFLELGRGGALGTEEGDYVVVY